jgi:hypothetical protein
MGRVAFPTLASILMRSRSAFLESQCLALEGAVLAFLVEASPIALVSVPEALPRGRLEGREQLSFWEHFLLPLPHHPPGSPPPSPCQGSGK